MRIMHEYVSQHDTTAYGILLELLKHKVFPPTQPCSLLRGTSNGEVFLNEVGDLQKSYNDGVPPLGRFAVARSRVRVNEGGELGSPSLVGMLQNSSREVANRA